MVCVDRCPGFSRTVCPATRTYSLQRNHVPVLVHTSLVRGLCGSAHIACSSQSSSCGAEWGIRFGTRAPSTAKKSFVFQFWFNTWLVLSCFVLSSDPAVNEAPVDTWQLQYFSSPLQVGIDAKLQGCTRLFREH